MFYSVTGFQPMANCMDKSAFRSSMGWRTACDCLWNPVSKLSYFWKTASSKWWTPVSNLETFWQLAYSIFGLPFPNWNFLADRCPVFADGGFPNCCSLKSAVHETLHTSFQNRMKLETCFHIKSGQRLPNENYVRSRHQHIFRRRYPIHIPFGNRLPHIIGRQFQYEVWNENRRSHKTRRRFLFHSPAMEFQRYGIGHGGF